jgi:predicted lipid-binding transport protein (Tim44 family)
VSTKTRNWLIFAVILLLALASPDVLARAGGGHSFSGGGSHSSGHSSSGGGYSSRGYSGGGSSDGDGLALIFWLLFQRPEIGVPVLIVVGVVTFYQKYQQSNGYGRTVTRSHSYEAWQEQPAVPTRKPPVRTGDLTRVDPDFSVPLFMDMARLVYTRAQEHSAQLDPLMGYLSPGARRTIETALAGDKVSDVCIGASQLTSVQVIGEWQKLKVRFEANLARRSGDGKTRQFLRVETWEFGRKSGSRSLGPDRMQELRCPSCGNASETRSDGKCTRCETVINDGRLMWIVRGIAITANEEVPRVALTLGGGMEAGTQVPTRPDDDVGPNLRRLSVMQPDFQPSAFQARAKATFLRVQQAWSTGDRAALRPLESDFLYQQHRYWLDRYAAEGLTNRCTDVRVRDVNFARVTVDGYVAAVTVRIFASMNDWTEDQRGKVLGGSKSEPRIFSEYWTFVRSIRAQPTQSAAAGPVGCPSCGAPLDRVSDAGICGYCEAKITSGTFDWVLNDIQQDEVWGG